MKIEGKWAVHETRDDRYFTGMDKENFPVLESMNSRVRLYKNKRAAECAIRQIMQTGIEYCEFVAEYIEHWKSMTFPKTRKRRITRTITGTRTSRAMSGSCWTDSDRSSI